MLERLHVGIPPRVLEAALALPARPSCGAVVCHPHPLYGGDMENSVVVAVADALVASGVAVLRFNFGGVGGSTGRYDDGRKEVSDAEAALDALRARLPAGAPIALVGYSFGAWVALRVRVPVCGTIAIAPPVDLLAQGAPPSPATAVYVVGTRDPFCGLDRLTTLVPRDAVRVVAGADHFFAGREEELAAMVGEAVARAATRA